MTLKGKKNHYNVKLLRGYRCGVRMKGNKVVLKNGADPFTSNQETDEWFITQIPYERIVIAGKGYVSTEAISLLAGHNINVILLDSYGNLVTNMCQTMSSDTATKYRMGQYDTFRNAAKVFYLQKQLLADKLESQVRFLRLLSKPELVACIDSIATYAQRYNTAKTSVICYA